jgi:hypothetical protein
VGNWNIWTPNLVIEIKDIIATFLSNELELKRTLDKNKTPTYERTLDNTLVAISKLTDQQNRNSQYLNRADRIGKVKEAKIECGYSSPLKFS